VLAAGGDAIEIALDGGVLRATRLQREGGKKLPAAEFAAEAGVKAGDVFRGGTTAP
jgi:methionyl-tRNA formyltransferase